MNLRGGADVESVPAARPRRMRATLVEDPERVADVYGRMLPTVGVAHAKRLRARAGRSSGYPTREELIEAIGGRRAVIELADR